MDRSELLIKMLFMSRGRYLLVCAIIFLQPEFALSQLTSRNQQISKDLTNAIKKLDIRLAEKHREDSTYQKAVDLLAHVKLLLAKCLNSLASEENYGTRTKTIAQYYNELQNYQSLIEKPEWIEHADSLNQALIFIEEDLRLKYDSASAVRLARSGLVNLRVRVLDPAGTRELKGYNVFVKPEISLDPRLIESFNPTNNAVKEIVPGRKLIWIEKNGARLAQRKEGVRKSDRRVTVDFILPQTVPER